MKRVQILLRDNVENVGRCGEVVQVAAGYARNFLLPKRMAVPATPENVKMMQRRRSRLDAEDAALLADVQSRIAAMAGVTIETAERSDENGRLFGSVSASTIVRLLAERGFDIEERDVRLDQPIKAVGRHEVAVHVHAEHSAVVAVEVIAAGA